MSNNNAGSATIEEEIVSYCLFANCVFSFFSFFFFSRQTKTLVFE